MKHLKLISGLAVTALLAYGGAAALAAPEAETDGPSLLNVEKRFHDMQNQLAKLQKDLFKDFDQSSFFGKFTKDRAELTSAFSISGPKRIDSGKDVKVVFSIKNEDKGKFDVRVDPTSITIDGRNAKSQQRQIASKSNESETVSLSEWNVAQSYPIPDDADPNHYRVDRGPGEITVIFGKKKP